MGELIDITGQITDGDIPATIARDTETAAAIAAHKAAPDPHPEYLLPSEGDGRYLQLQYKKITFTTGMAQGANVSTIHGLDPSKILSFSSIVKVNLSNSAGFAPLVAPGGLQTLTGYNYSVHLDANYIFCRLSSTDSANILNKQITVTILYEP